jgi:hypothetical protein
MIGRALALCLLPGLAAAEGIPLPSCDNADGSRSELYDVAGDRFVTGLSVFPDGTGTTLFLDCGSSQGYEVLHSGGMPQVLDAEGRDVTPPSPLDIIRNAMWDEAPQTMRQIMQAVSDAGFAARAADPAAQCLCNPEMRHAFN